MIRFAAMINLGSSDFQFTGTASTLHFIAVPSTKEALLVNENERYIKNIRFLCHYTQKSDVLLINYLINKYLKWSWRGLNPRPNAESIGFLHA